MSKRKRLPPAGQLAQNADTRQYVATSQIAQELAVTKQTMRRALDKAGVPYLQRGNRRYYQQHLIDAFVASRTVTPKAG
jgi:hypothetical protein